MSFATLQRSNGTRLAMWQEGRINGVANQYNGDRVAIVAMSVDHRCDGATMSRKRQDKLIQNSAKQGYFDKYEKSLYLKERKRLKGVILNRFMATS